MHFASYLQFGWMNRHLSANLQLGKTLKEKKLSQKLILGAKSPNICYTQKPKYRRKPEVQWSSCWFLPKRGMWFSTRAVHPHTCTQLPFLQHSPHAVNNSTTSLSGQFALKLLSASQDTSLLVCGTEWQRHCGIRPSQRGVQSSLSNTVFSEEFYFEFSYTRF